MFSIEGISASNGIVCSISAVLGLVITITAFAGAVQGSGNTFCLGLGIVSLLIVIGFFWCAFSAFQYKRLLIDGQSIRIYRGKILKHNINLADVTMVKVTWGNENKREIVDSIRDFSGFSIKTTNEEIHIGTALFISDSQKIFEAFKELVRIIHWQGLNIIIQ